MNFDSQIKNINDSIKNSFETVVAGEIPNLSNLEKEIDNFIKNLKNLSVADQKEYLNLLDVWSIEFRKLSEKLIETKSNLKKEMGNIETNNKAALAYSSAKKWE